MKCNSSKKNYILHKYSFFYEILNISNIKSLLSTNAAVLFALFVTMAMSIALFKIERIAYEQAFEQDLRQITRAIEQQVRTYEYGLRTAASLLDVNELTSTRIAAASAPLKIATAYRGIEAIGYLPPQVSGQLSAASFLQNTGDDHQSSPGPAFWLTFSKTTESDLLKRQLLSAELLQWAHAKSRHRTSTLISDQLLQLQPHATTATGFLMLLPLLNGSHLPSQEAGSGEPSFGTLLVAIDANAFFAEALQYTPPAIDVQVFSGHTTNPEFLLHHRSLGARQARASLLTREMTSSGSLDLLGQPWTIVARTSARYAPPYPAYLSAITAIAGLLLTLSLLAWNTGRHRRAARVPLPEAAEQAGIVRTKQLEAVAGIGHYEMTLDCKSGCHTQNWSDGMFELLGLPATGDALPIAAYASRFVHADDRNRVLATLEKAMEDGTRAACEYKIVRSDGSTAYLYDWLLASPAESGKRRIYGFRQDITQQRIAEKERYTGAAKFQSLLDQLPGVPYLAYLGKDSSVMYVSPKAEALLGFTAEEWAADRDLRIRQLHPADRERVLRTIAAARTSNGAFSMEYRIYHRNGTLLWLHDEARYISNPQNQLHFLQGVVFDITERQKIQHDLLDSHQRLQQMIADLNTLREQEHKRLAKELHDDLGQLLAALKMDMAMLQTQLPACDVQLAQMMTGINEVIDAMVTSMRRIIADLPPKELDDNGLLAALQLLATSFSQRHQIACHLDTPENEIMLLPSITKQIYRLVQEALNNIAKHAKATRVGITLKYEPTQVVLTVSDNGKGIVAEDLHKTGSFGLNGMRERVAELGGKLHINSIPGTGSTLQFVIPLSPASLLHS